MLSTAKIARIDLERLWDLGLGTWDPCENRPLLANGESRAPIRGRESRGPNTVGGGLINLRSMQVY